MKGDLCYQTFIKIIIGISKKLDMSAFYKLSPPATPVKSSKPLLLKY